MSNPDSVVCDDDHNCTNHVNRDLVVLFGRTEEEKRVRQALPLWGLVNNLVPGLYILF